MTKEDYLKLAESKWEALESLKSESNFYDYEKKFESIMLVLGKEILHEQFKGASEDRRKKKVQTRFGQITFDKSGDFYKSLKNSSFSPYLKELLVYVGQEENYAGAVRMTEKLLRLATNPMQIQRLVMEYGEVVEDLLEEETPSLELEETECVYAMVDGSMLLTRPTEWKEAKIGRVFKEGDINQVTKDRKEILHAEYAAHLGNHQVFEEKMSILVDKYERLDARLVFINDGARWIGNWIDATYPNATQILDFFHAMEHISAFSKLYFASQATHLEWVEEIRQLLKTKGIEEVLAVINSLEKGTKAAQKEHHKLLTYLKNNAHRMDYPQYIEKGLCIGSGAIEAAQRTISQKRLKQSGQRWSKKGAQYVLNLRVLNHSNRWNELQELMRAA